MKKLTSRKLAALMWGVASIVALNVLWVISDQVVLPDQYLAGMSLLAISGLCGYELRVQSEIDKKTRPLLPILRETEGREPAPIDPSPRPAPPSWRESELPDPTPSQPSLPESEYRGDFDYEEDGRPLMS